ncbi:MAG: Deoxyuridine 5'-triphosphate nucleotidohydrolase [Parcubacteria group bacterium ADurb.Bin216]|nr:MAG: Deoxyuridine 5'-triphosphate nucleotidohydrolase [Parcubacteria group bacterium ADurb.Bin216]
MVINFVKVTPYPVMPAYATDGSGCFDLFANSSRLISIGGKEALICGLGIAVEIPQDWVMEIYSRSGLGFKYNIVLANGTGIIDSDYRGEVQVALVADSSVFQHLVELASSGKAIAQAKLAFAPKVIFNEVDKLSDTARGIGGFGSTDDIDPVDRIQHG